MTLPSPLNAVSRTRRGEPDREEVVAAVVRRADNEDVAVGGLDDPLAHIAGARSDVGGPDAITGEGGVEDAVGIEAQDEDVVVAAVIAASDDQQVAVGGDVEAVAVVVSRADGVERLAVRRKTRVQVPRRVQPNNPNIPIGATMSISNNHNIAVRGNRYIHRVVVS